MQLFLLLLVWLLIAIGAHFTVKRYFLASFLAAGAMVIATQVAGYLQIKQVDPFWQVSSLVGFLLALIVALVVGLPFRLVRLLSGEDSRKSGGQE